MTKYSRAVATMVLTILLTGILYAQNQFLDVMTFLSGEFAGSEFGCAVASLDFNADGYNDLVVASQAWNPNLLFNDQNRWGKLYFYWGGPNFDNVPDFVILGSYAGQMNYIIIYNAGDINGDGIEDLIVNQNSVNNEIQLAVYFGRQNPQTTPDIILTFPYPEINGIMTVPIGDINGDNHSDVFLILGLSNDSRKLMIWDDYESQPWLFKQTANSQTITLLSGIGDVNGDGFDDCLLHIPVNNTGETNNRLILYYGSSTFPQTDSLVIINDSNSIINRWGCPLGDVNGDGIDDFTADSNIYGYTHHLWLGSSNLTAEWDITLSGDWYDLSHHFSESGTGYPFVHGDLNGDGFQDFLSFHHEAGYYDGYLYLWMGGNQMNGTMDGIQYGIYGYDTCNFGYSKITGDFNADGLCDVAVGAPWWGTNNDHWKTGRVYIFSGNTNLHDTTVANEDNTIPAIDTAQWKIDVYPNPVSSEQTSLYIKFVGSGYQTAQNLKLRVYNIKGQRIFSKTIPPSKMHEGLWEINPPSMGVGLFMVSISQQNINLITQKIVIQ